MDGKVDSLGRALVRIRVKPSIGESFVELDAWVDTGFTGELVLRDTIVSALGLPRSFAVSAGLGDGSEVVLDTFTCLIQWNSRKEPTCGQSESLFRSHGKLALRLVR